MSGSGEGAREFRNQAGSLLSDAQALRGELQSSGAQPRDLQAVDETIRALREMNNRRADTDLKSLQALSAAALDQLKRLEFDLRKRSDTTSDQLLLSGTDEAPANYKALVDEYFRSLSRGTTGTGAADKR
jgi:hypothetical protein